MCFNCIIHVSDPGLFKMWKQLHRRQKKKAFLPEDNTPLSKWAINLALLRGSLCKCTQFPQVHSLQSCQMLPGPATSVTHDPFDSCFVLGTPCPSDIPPLKLPQMTDSPVLSVPTHYPSGLWPRQHLLPRLWDCPCIPVKALKPETPVSSSPGPRNQELNDTKKQRERERGGRGSRWCRTGLKLVLCVSARRGSSWVKLHHRKRGGRGRRNCWRLWILSAFVCLVLGLLAVSQRAWLTAAWSFLLTHCSEPNALQSALFKVNEPLRSRPRVWELGMRV